jgi:hypothetical protein
MVLWFALIALLLILSGLFLPSLIIVCWIAAGAIALAITARYIASALTSIATAMPSPPSAPRLLADRADAPRPGDPDWLDWANGNGKYGSQ